MAGSYVNSAICIGFGYFCVRRLFGQQIALFELMVQHRNEHTKNQQW